MIKYGDKNFDTAFKLYKSEVINSIEELREGVDDDPDAIEGFNAVIDEVRDADHFGEIEQILIRELGYEEDMISNEYQWAMARLVEMKKKELFVEVI